MCIGNVTVSCLNVFDKKGFLSLLPLYGRSPVVNALCCVLPNGQSLVRGTLQHTHCVAPLC